MSTTADPEQSKNERPPEAHSSADRPLPPGTVLRGYELRGIAGSSAWSIVYEAWDRSLRRRVAVQEYRPAALAVRRDDGTLEAVAGAADLHALGLKAFIAEARLLARFDHPALLRIYRFWEERGTAYRAMPLHEAPTLESVLAQSLQDEAAVRAWLRPLLDGVAVLHGAHACHHHIVPASIVLTSNGPVLLDMAAARRIVEAVTNVPIGAADAPYAAIELDGDAATHAAGPWTDLYALGAIAYRALTGIVPPRAAERVRGDPVAHLHALASGRCSARFASAIEAALAVSPERRPRDADDFRALAGGLELAPPTWPAPLARDLMSVPFLPDPRREVTVPVSTEPGPLAPTEGATLPAASRSAGAARPVPISRSEQPVPRAAWWGLAVGVVTLGAIAAVALRGYAHRSEPAVAGAAVERTEIASGAWPAASIATVPLRDEAKPPVVRAAPAVDVLRTLDVTSSPRDDRDRQERCADLLQEATLRRLVPAESAFFRKECR